MASLPGPPGTAPDGREGSAGAGDRVQPRGWTLPTRPRRPSPQERTRARALAPAKAAPLRADSCEHRGSHLSPPARVGTAAGTGGGSSACHLPCHPRGAAVTLPLQMRRTQSSPHFPGAAPSDAPHLPRPYPTPAAIWRQWRGARPRAQGQAGAPIPSRGHHVPKPRGPATSRCGCWAGNAGWGVGREPAGPPPGPTSLDLFKTLVGPSQIAKIGFKTSLPCPTGGLVGTPKPTH